MHSHVEDRGEGTFAVRTELHMARDRVAQILILVARSFSVKKDGQLMKARNLGPRYNDRAVSRFCSALKTWGSRLLVAGG